jgi:hypothetical protein
MPQNACSVRLGRPVVHPAFYVQNGGYRVSHDRGAVTVGNEAPVWPLADSRQRYDDVIGNFPV